SSICRSASTGARYYVDGTPRRLLGEPVRRHLGAFARGPRRRPHLRLGDGADTRRRLRAADRRVRPDAPVPGDHPQGPRRARVARGERRAHARVRDTCGHFRRRRTRTPRSLRRDLARELLRRDQGAREPGVARRDRSGRDRRGMNERQIYPPSITGKGARFAPGGSVLDHAFGKSDPYTLGVEEEYMLLDGETFDLVQHIDTVLAAVAGHELEPVINPELMQSVLEIATPVCRTTGEVAEQLRRIRGYVIGVARDQGMRVGSAGTHPFSLFERQRITAKDRYRALVDQMQYVARREL